MELHKDFGVVAKEVGWVPAPGYLLRRHRVLAILGTLVPGQLLEVGCGAGALIHDLAQRDFKCSALETSVKARAIAAYINQHGQLALYAEAEDWQEKFDQILALEVLEHISDDRESLRLWHSWLKPGGRILISVPAYQRRWRADDVAVGHYRRYEKASLVQMVQDSGFSIDHFENWGFPLANIIRPLRVVKYEAKLRRDGQTESTVAHLSAESGVDRGIEARLFPLQASGAGVITMKMFFWLQDLFSRAELGDGFLLLATRK